MKLEDVPEDWLRAWVDAGTIPLGVYEAEMRRRRDLDEASESGASEVLTGPVDRQ